MEEELLNLVQSSKIFSSLSEANCKKLLPKFQKVTLVKDEILFHQGDTPDCVYILASGKLSAYLVTANGETKLINYINIGETVGELGALSNEPRTLTIKAAKDSVLLKLSNKDFLHICHEYPAVMFATIHPVIARSQNLIDLISPEKKKKHIAIIPANHVDSLEEFTQRLSDSISKIPNLVFLSDYSEETKGLTPAAIQGMIDQIEAGDSHKKRFIYLVKSHDTHLGVFSFKKADMIYVVADAVTSPHIDNLILEKIEKRKARLKSSPELILVHPEKTILPKNTSEWLKLAPFGLHHHIRIKQGGDYKRLLRFMRDKAVGLVLGGGGTRGWAHLGVMKAMEEHKIPIDIIGGTSVGAIIGACYASSLSFEATCNKFTEIVKSSKHSVSWRSITWPAISLFDAKNFTLSQQKAFDTIQIEDLWIPYFCISANLAKNSETIHTSGLVWEKLRASSAIPGLIPPMIIDGEIHFDGGLLNNLPVDVMRQIIGAKGKIFAVELAGNQMNRKKYSFPPILPFIPALLAKLRLGYLDYKFPRFIDTFLKAIFAGSLLRMKQNTLSANHLISLDLTKFSMLHANIKQGARLMELGYQEGLKQLSERKHQVE